MISFKVDGGTRQGGRRSQRSLSLLSSVPGRTPVPAQDQPELSKRRTFNKKTAPKIDVVQANKEMSEDLRSLRKEQLSVSRKKAKFGSKIDRQLIQEEIIQNKGITSQVSFNIRNASNFNVVRDAQSIRGFKSGFLSQFQSKLEHNYEELKRDERKHSSFSRDQNSQSVQQAQTETENNVTELNEDEKATKCQNITLLFQNEIEDGSANQM